MVKLQLDAQWSDIKLKPHARAKNFKLKWSAEQGFKLSFPSSLLKRSFSNLFLSSKNLQKELESFLEANLNWIEAYRKKNIESPPKKQSLITAENHPQFQNFHVIWKVAKECHRDEFSISLSRNQLRIYSPTQEEINSYSSQEKIYKAFRNLEKKEALSILEPRIRLFAKSKHLELNKVTCKQMKTRWGSCSSKKNINLNAQIIRLPQELQDYILWHELAHLQQANHSHLFWELVEEWYPGAQKLDKELNQYQIEL